MLGLPRGFDLYLAGLENPSHSALRLQVSLLTPSRLGIDGRHGVHVISLLDLLGYYRLCLFLGFVWRVVMAMGLYPSNDAERRR